MAILRFDPIRSFEAISNKMSSIMSDIDKGVNIEYGGFSPKVDISEDDAKVYFYFEIPGLKKEDVKVTINEENILTIKGEKKREQKLIDNPEDKTYIRCERMFGGFTRSFLLPDTVSKESINAMYESGILNLTFDNVQPVKPRDFEVEIK